MMEYIDKNNIDLAIIDIRGINKLDIGINPIQRFILLVQQRKNGSMDNLLFRFVKISRNKGIKIFMMGHGPFPIFWEYFCI